VRRVIPVSAHAAFYKAADYFKIKLHTIPVNHTTRQVDLKQLARAMSVLIYSLCALRLTFASQ
jgi:sphinganine-1-phosphate aldolase